MFNRLGQYKKFHIIDIKSLRTLGRRGRYRNYYVKPVRNGKNNLAKNIDFYVFLVAISTVIFLTAAAFTESPGRAFIYSLPAILSGIFIVYRLRKAFEAEAAAHKRIWKAGLQCQEWLKSLEDSQRLLEAIAEMLGRLRGFSDVHFLRELEDSKGLDSINMSLRAVRNGVPVAVGCTAPGSNQECVSADLVIVFKEEIRRLNITDGILFSTGSFSNEARRASREGKIRMALVDLYGLVELSRISGHRSFPQASQQEEGSIPENRKNMQRKLTRFAFMREKARGYLFAAVLLFALYFWGVTGETMEALYLIFGTANLAISLYCIISNREPDLLDSSGKTS